MLARFSALLPSAANFMQQIAPSVVATLIAAGLISGYNHAFSGHLKQPRMAALHAEETDAVELAPVPAAAPATATVATVKPPARPATNTVTIHERADEPERVLEKELAAELGKDQTAAKVAVAPAPSPRPATTTAATEPKIIDRRPDPRVASVPYVVPPAPAPVMVAPVAAPPAMAAPVTVPPPRRLCALCRSGRAAAGHCRAAADRAAADGHGAGPAVPASAL